MKTYDDQHITDRLFIGTYSTFPLAEKGYDNTSDISMFEIRTTIGIEYSPLHCRGKYIKKLDTFGKCPEDYFKVEKEKSTCIRNPVLNTLEKDFPESYDYYLKFPRKQTEEELKMWSMFLIGYLIGMEGDKYDL